MAVAITIPRLGWNMEQGIFLGWLKQDGDTVRLGEPLFTLEWDKATQEIEASEHGILRLTAAAPRSGDLIDVGSVIGYLAGPGETETDLSDAQSTRERGEPAPVSVARPAAAAAHPVSHSKRFGRSERPRSSPLARRLARELGIDWTRLRGSGASGRIRKVDVLAAREGRAADVARTGPPHEVAEGPSGVRSIPIGSIRRTIATRLLDSHRSSAPVTLSTTADATNLVNLRAQFQAAGSHGREIPLPGYTEFLVKLAAMALGDHPLLNARWNDERAVIEIPAEAHIGIAVDTEAGLVVPVIRGVARLSLREIVARSRDLVLRAREQRLGPDDVHGGTFTITNLGSYGIETFTPIINPRECAILGMGRIQRQPVMVGDQVVARERMSLSLTFDHRIVDGAPAARFLQSLVRLIENPGPWLIP
jgi:pyruvate dehydrogenase E2 component (dihydrolipoamide acetyltransferase)